MLAIANLKSTLKERQSLLAFLFNWPRSDVKFERSIRRLSKYCLVSLLLSSSAYFLAYCRGNPYVVDIFGETMLRYTEATTSLLGTSMLAVPAIAILLTLFNESRPIGDVQLPDIKRVFLGAIIILIDLLFVSTEWGPLMFSVIMWEGLLITGSIVGVVLLVLPTKFIGKTMIAIVLIVSPYLFWIIIISVILHHFPIDLLRR